MTAIKLDAARPDAAQELAESRYSCGMGTDADEVHAWRAGDEAAGEALFERYYDGVARFFYNKVGEQAADLIQRTFLACLEGLERLEDPERFRSYLFGIAHNQLRKFYRNKHRDAGKLDFNLTSVHDLAPTPSRLIANRQEERLLLEGLRRIPLDYQVALELFYWEGMSAAEIGEVVGIPLGTAKTRLRRARQLLRDELAQIAASPELLRTTLDGLDGWAQGLRAQVADSEG
ncbi:RNA polymerase sigma factor [Haliangium sp.]|uniref:RNA polymerase sigma factor n=1 Tax=Haliangium sp. TaxID=2663208 RepID=UPI003D130321